MIMILIGMGFAAVLAAAENQEQLPGSELSIDAAVNEAQIIVVARAFDIGLPIMGGSAGATYGSVNLRLSRTLKGGTMPRNLRLGGFLVRSFIDKPGEVPPSENRDYIFFIERRGPNNLRCIKLLLSTNENLASVTAAQRRGDRLPGSALGIFEATECADVIVIGKLLESEKLRSLPSKSGTFIAAKVISDRTLKGEMEGIQLPKFKVMRGPDELSERAPDVGRDYLFFLQKREGAATNWFKVVPASIENINNVYKTTQYPR